MSVAPWSGTGMPGLRSWRAWAPWALVLLVLLLTFRNTAASMVAIWIRSDTFAHAFLVPVISIWLVWRGKDRLAGLPVAPVPWLLLPLALLCLLWLLGELASVQAAQHFALVALVVVSVPAVLGWPVARALAFPLGFLFFAVPAGEFMLPWLIEMTADFTVTALRLSGIPVYREGQQFVIPSGNWSVVEACSGLRYLVASFMVGTLFAYLTFSTLRRRLAFVGVSLLVPLVANWVRAYLIVLIGHLSGNKLAVGADHLVYGWVFFGIVMVLMFMVGARWSDDGAKPRLAPATRADTALAPSVNLGSWAQAAGVAVLCSAVLLYQGRLDAAAPDAQMAQPWPGTLPGGWNAGPPSAQQWKPAFQAPSAEFAAHYVRGADEVGAWLGFYRQQTAERKMVSSTNLLVANEDAQWSLGRQGLARVDVGGHSITWRTAELNGAGQLVGVPRKMQVWRLYWVGGRWLSGDAETKLYTAWDRLLGRSGNGAVLMLYAALPADRQPAFQDLAVHLLPALSAQLEQASRPQ